MPSSVGGNGITVPRRRGTRRVGVRCGGCEWAVPVPLDRTPWTPLGNMARGGEARAQAA